VTGRSPLLEVEDLHVSYGRLQVLRGTSIEVGDGEAVALLGTNGAGKSTLLKAVCGVLAAERGRVRIDGIDVTGADPRRILSAGVVQVPGGRATFPELTVEESLRVACWPFRHDRARVEAGCARVFDRFPILGERRGQLAGTLSGGQQQMLALARALVHEPRLLLIDELTLGLAPIVAGELVETVRELRAGGVSLLLVDQRLATAVQITERAYFLERGEVRFSGPTAELHERSDLVRSVFLRGGSAT
jgi:ABC-type branched-subunit amino acid transport system ATPase component